MRIGVDARPLSYQLSGIGFYLNSLLDELQQIDHQNEYLLISNAPIDYPIRNPKWRRIEGRFTRKLTSTLWMQAAAPILAAAKGIDLFWGPRHHLPLFLPRYTKTVLTIHDVIHRKYPETLALPNLLVERILMGRSIKMADRIIADSTATALDIQAAYVTPSEKISTIYPGVPNLSGVTNPPGGIHPELPDTYFLFVGTMDPRKNLVRILQAFDRIDPVRRNLHLVVVGGQGWKNNKLREELSKMPSRPHIHVMGYVTRDALSRLYRHSLCLVFPSLYEGFGFPILEAMSMGVPVITSNTSSMKEISGDAACLVDPHGVDTLADAMVTVLSDIKFRNGLIQKGRERVRQFSWHRCAQQTLKIFNAALAG